MKALLLLALAFVACTPASAQEMRLIQSPVAVTVTTAGGTGIGRFSVKVPGTFAGPTSTTNARFLSYIEIFADSPAMGDYVDSITLSDDDGVIPAPLRSRFRSYPVIMDFSADTGVGDVAGYYLSQNGETRIGTFPQLGQGAREEPQQIPSGLYLKATIHQSGLLSRNFRVNVMWGRVFQ